MNIYIVVLNWNGKENTLACLASTSKLRTENFELRTLVVDNASTDDSVNAIKKAFPNITILENKENLGYAGGMNVGINYALEAHANFVMLLNNDTIVDHNVIVEMLSIMNLHDKVGIVSPKIYFAKGYEYHKDRYKDEEKGKVIWYAGGKIDWANILASHSGVDEVDHGQFGEMIELLYASGCCMFIRTDPLKKVGLFDERYYLYYEDIDLSLRIRNAGYKILFAPKAILWHKNAGSAGGSGSPLQDYYISRNRMLFGLTYASLRSKIAMIKESIKIATNGRKWQKKGILNFYLMKFGKGPQIV